MKFDNQLEKYILDHTQEADSILQELERETYLNVLRPRMLSGHLQGKMLEMFSSMIKPMCILEIGTYTGYSAICMARGLQPNGKLHTIEINDELENLASKYFEKAELKNKIIQHVGDAKEIIPQLNKAFDLIFIDADKRDYCEYYQLVFEKLKPGGFIIADNILWSGKVIEKQDPTDEQTMGIIRFNKMIKEDLRVQQLILPIRDGLMLIQKL